MADEQVKASELKVGDKIRVEVRGQEMEVELDQVDDDPDFAGEHVVVLRFGTPDQEGFLTRRVPPDEKVTKVG